MGGFDDFPSEDVVLPVEVEAEAIELSSVRKLTKAESAAAEQRRLQRVENDIYDKSMDIVDMALGFADVPPQVGDEAPVPPKAWIEEYGKDEAERRFRVAKWALLPANQAPVGLRLAQTTALGIIKARESRKAPPIINVQMMQMPAPTNYQLPEKSVDED